MRTIAENYRLPDYTMSPTYSICKDHGYLIGEHKTCPICGQEAEVYSRITGYYRPVKNWNEGKTQEYKNRTTYDVAHSVLRKNPEAAEAVKRALEDGKRAVLGAAEKALGAGAGAGAGMAPSDQASLEAAASVRVPAGAAGSGVYLFTTKTCPNCKMAKEFLKGVDYEVVDAEEHPDMTDQFGIMQAPTLVVVKDGRVEKFVNASNIRRFAERK